MIIICQLSLVFKPEANSRWWFFSQPHSVLLFSSISKNYLSPILENLNMSSLILDNASKSWIIIIAVFWDFLLIRSINHNIQPWFTEETQSTYMDGIHLGHPLCVRKDTVYALDNKSSLWKISHKVLHLAQPSITA